MFIKQVSPPILFPLRKHWQQDGATQILFASAFSAVTVTGLPFLCLRGSGCALWDTARLVGVLLVVLLFHVTSQLLCMDCLSFIIKLKEMRFF